MFKNYLKHKYLVGFVIIVGIVVSSEEHDALGVQFLLSEK
jgi:hypothetical protein